MNDADDSDTTARNGFASPPCALHELDSVTPPADPAVWRRTVRERLLAERLALSAAERASLAERIAAGLDALLGDLTGVTVGAYWPIRGEPDLRPWMQSVVERGGICALPVVVERARPLAFRRWIPGAPMERGVWNILVPADPEPVRPQVLIAPVVGFDRAAYRLGYGGGFFDRTLAAFGADRPRMIGVGYQRAQLDTIYPQAHDVPMDCVVTETGAHCPGPV